MNVPGTNNVSGMNECPKDNSFWIYCVTFGVIEVNVRMAALDVV